MDDGFRQTVLPNFGKKKKKLTDNYMIIGFYVSLNEAVDNQTIVSTFSII